MNNNLQPIIEQYKHDIDSVYNTWFVNNDERLKAFRSIRKGIQQVIDDIRNGSFPNDFKGSSLEFNRLFGEKRKLGSWSEYLTMRAVILKTNRQLRNLLSSDLGAIAGLLFEIGSSKLLIVLPLVPAYLSYISGVSVNELRQQDERAALIRRHALAQSLWFVAGFSLIFIALGATATRHLAMVEKVSGVLLILVGILIFIGSFSMISGWLVLWFPVLADIEGAFIPLGQ